MPKGKPTKEDRERAAGTARVLIARIEEAIARIKNDDDPTQDIEAIERARMALRGVRMEAKTIALALILEALHRGQAYEARAVQLHGTKKRQRGAPFQVDDFCVVVAMAMYAQALAVETLPLEPELWVELMTAWRKRPGPPTKAARGLKGEGDKWVRLARLIEDHWSTPVDPETLKSNWQRWTKGPDHLAR